MINKTLKAKPKSPAKTGGASITRPERPEHFVQFYEDNTLLMRSVAEFIGGGLGMGCPAVVIATAAHREDLETRLADQGVDLATVRARRQLVMLDAQAMLDKFMRNGMPSETLFRESVGAVVAFAAGKRGLRAFGEMVALLWDQGMPEAAIRLEELWNGLGKDYAFSLFCAYPMAGFKGAGQGPNFERVCGTHSRVIPAELSGSHAVHGAELARVQQQALSLEAEIHERKRTETALLQALADLEKQAQEAEVLREHARRESVDRIHALDSSLHLAAIVESSDDAIISTDLNTLITSWNRGAERMFGYEAADIIGRPITVLIPLNRHDEEPGILNRIRRGERVDHYETVRQRKDGVHLDISLTVSPIRNSLGEIIGASKIARDITQRKRDEVILKYAKEQLAKAKSELERRVEERTASLREAVAQMEEFSYTVSHDLRAPLRGMQTYARALMEDFGEGLDPEARHYLKRIADNATRLDRMILDVLTFSRVARAEIRLERVDLDRLVREIVQQYPGMQPAHAEVIVERLDGVLGHESSLTQAVSNLIANAIKFVPAGTRPRVRIWTEKRGPEVRAWIEDNGIGIDPRHQGRLFNMFERIHPNLPYEGTGVGLAIVRKAMERMGGKVGMESDGSQGSRFWLQLRAAKE